MIGEVDGKKFKLKAMEAYGFTVFIVGFLAARGEHVRYAADPDRVIKMGECLLEYIRVTKNAPVNLSAETHQDAETP